MRLALIGSRITIHHHHLELKSNKYFNKIFYAVFNSILVSCKNLDLGCTLSGFPLALKFKGASASKMLILKIA